MTRVQLEALRSEMVYRCRREPDPAARAVIYSELMAVQQALDSAPIACGCGTLHAPEEWDKLKYVGLQDDLAGGAFELRLCSQCSSSIAKQVQA